MKLVPDTPLKTTIAVILGLIGTTGTVVWVFTNGVRDVKQEIADLRSEVALQRAEAWTYNDQARWVSVFAKENRFTSIEVPLVPERPKQKPN